MCVLIKAGQEHKNLIHMIFQLFSYDMSENKLMAIGWNGEYPSPSKEELYIDGDGYETFIISYQGEPAGLVVLLHEEGQTYLKHFFILRAYRSKGVAKEALLNLFNTYQGNWYLSTFDHNLNAKSFWQGFLNRYTKELKVTRRKDDKGPEYHFSTFKEIFYR